MNRTEYAKNCEKKKSLRESSILVIVLFFMVIMFFEVRAFGADSDNLSDEAIDNLARTRVEGLTTAPTKELLEAWREPLQKDFQIEDLVEDAAYEVCPGKIRDIFETKIADLKDRKNPISLECRVAYLRKLVVFKSLMERKELSPLDWMLSRKDSSPPTFLDALLSNTVEEKDIINSVSEDMHSKWLLLSEAKNPISRMFAITCARQWAKKKEMTQLLAEALADEYFYTRLLAIELFKTGTPEGTQEILENFLKRDIRKDLPENHANKENLLNSIATETLEKLERGEKRNYPKEERRTYKVRDRQPYVYLVQEPAKPIPDDASILVYMHGAAGEEEQGMSPNVFDGGFAGLRKIMNDKGWIYICPRDAEFKGLRNDLLRRYGERKIILAGASAGGRAVFEEARTNPGLYSGLILMCPAMRYPKVGYSDKNFLSMPVWIVCGERDHISIAFSRKLAKDLKRLDRKYHYIEVSDGDHDAPVEKINWKKAVEFVSQ